MVEIKPEIKDRLTRGTKTKLLVVRVTRNDKDEFQEAAKSLNITLSKYVLGLHRLAIGKEPELFIRKSA